MPSNGALGASRAMQAMRVLAAFILFAVVRVFINGCVQSCVLFACFLLWGVTLVCQATLGRAQVVRI